MRDTEGERKIEIRRCRDRNGRRESETEKEVDRESARVRVRVVLKDYEEGETFIMANF